MIEELDSFLDNINGKTINDKLADFIKSGQLKISHLTAIYDFGEKLYNTMQLKEAEAVFIAYSSLCPYDHRGIGTLVSISIEQKNYRKALELLNVLKTFPTCVLDDVFVNIALCHYKLNEHDNAAAVLLSIDQSVLNEFFTTRYKYLEKQLNKHLN